MPNCNWASFNPSSPPPRISILCRKPIMDAAINCNQWPFAIIYFLPLYCLSRSLTPPVCQSIFLSRGGTFGVVKWYLVHGVFGVWITDEMGWGWDVPVPINNGHECSHSVSCTMSSSHLHLPPLLSLSSTLLHQTTLAFGAGPKRLPLSTLSSSCAGCLCYANRARSPSIYMCLGHVELISFLALSLVLFAH